MRRTLSLSVMLLVFVMIITFAGCGGGNNKNSSGETTDMALLEFRDALIASTNWVMEGGNDVIKSSRMERNGDLLCEGNYMGLVYWLRTTDQYFYPQSEQGKSPQDLEERWKSPQDIEWKEGVVGSTIHGSSFDEYVEFMLTRLFNILTGGDGGAFGKLTEIEYKIENGVLTYTATFGRITERVTIRLGGSTVTIPQYVLDNVK